MRHKDGHYRICKSCVNNTARENYAPIPVPVIDNDTPTE
jgi:hypothetical protein